MMVTALPQLRGTRTLLRALRLVPIVLALSALAAVTAFLAWSYVAQPAHPDGVCYESRGRPIPCVILEQRRAAQR